MSASQGMNDAAKLNRRYQLRSELALETLRGGGSSWDRGLIWVNAVCATVLLLGIFGLKRPQVVQARKPLADQEVLTLPVVFRPPETDVSPPATENAPLTEPSFDPAIDFVEDVVLPTIVAPDAAEVAFPVPVEGPTIVASTAALAAPPPARSVPVEQSLTSGPQIFRSGQGVADGGFYPDPEYPREASMRQEQGRTQVLIEVSEEGRVVRAEVRVSSGSTVLDRHTVAHVRRFWRFPAGVRREYLWTAEYVLR